MAEDSTIQFNVDPSRTPIFFADTTLIGSTDQVITLSFAQSVLDAQQQSVVSRIAMTVSQAKIFLKDLNDHIEKFER